MRRLALVLLLVLALLLALPPCAAAEPFLAARDVAREAGLDFVHAGFHAGASRDQSAFYEETSGGACWGDVDRDGRLDVFLTDFVGPAGEGRSRLFRNAGPGPAGGRFEDATDAADAGLRGVGQGCAFGDHDNDGWPDLYATFAVTPYSLQRNVLLRNDRGRFVDVTSVAGVAGDEGPGGTPCDPAVPGPAGDVPRCWSTSAAWLDHDLDGDLDLYVANYAQFPLGACTDEFNGNPVFCRGQPNRLYRNEGDGTFTEVGEAAGVAFNGQSTLGRSLGVVAGDIDGDAWPDLYVTNDKDANALYLNQRDGTFRDAARELAADNFGATEEGPQHRAGMGVDAQDVDNDGDVDLLSTHLRAEYDALYRWDGRRYEDVAAALGYDENVSFDVTRWGAAFLDVDLDGWKDIVVVAGGQARAEPGGMHLMLQRDGRFERQGSPAWPWAAEGRANHRGLSWADVDDDGDPDLLASTLPSWPAAEARPRLLRLAFAGEGSVHPENPAAGRRWLRVTLEGTDGARDAVGATVTVATEGLTQHRVRTSGGGYAGSSDPRLLFGLGYASTGSVRVTWPGGATSNTTFDLAGAPGLALRLEEPNARPPPPVGWTAAPQPVGGHVLLAWRPSMASDFASYRVEQGARPDFPPGEAAVRSIPERGATQALLNASDGRYARVVVVDAAGHRSAPGPELDLQGARKALPLPPNVGALALAAAAATLTRRGAVGPRMRSLLLGLALLAGLAPTALAEPSPGEDFRITLAPGAAPRFEGQGVTATLVANTTDQLEWRLASAKERLVGTVVSEGAWPVERPRQIVPEARADGMPDADWHFFAEVGNVSDSEGWARVANITAQGPRVALALAFPVNTTLREAGLRVTRDLAPPGFSLGPVTNLTHFSFYIETTTTEYALADLVVRRLPAGEPVPNPTTILALLQRFPIQGLHPDADHAFHVAFTDWAGNVARSAEQRVHTQPKPVLPAPVVTTREPPPNATLAAPVRQVALNFTGPPPQWPGGVAVFIDKVPVHEGVSLGPGRVEVALARPLGPGPHTVGIELTTPDGGLAVERWGFEVAAPTPFPAMAALAALGATAFLRRRAA